MMRKNFFVLFLICLLMVFNVCTVFADEIKYGDADADGILTIKDAVMLLNYIENNDYDMPIKEYWYNTYVDPNYEKIGYNNVVCGWSDILQMGEWLGDTAKSGAHTDYNQWISDNNRRTFYHKK